MIKERKVLLEKIEQQAVEKHNLEITIEALRRREVVLGEILQHVINIENLVVFDVPLAKDKPKIQMTATPVAEETFKKLTKHAQPEEKVRKSFSNDITKKLNEKYKTFRKILWYPDIIRDISMALNSSYENVLSISQLRQIIQPILDKHGKPSYFFHYTKYFEEDGMLSAPFFDKHCKKYRVNKDKNIPKKEKELGILEELGYDKTNLS